MYLLENEVKGEQSQLLQLVTSISNAPNSKGRPVGELISAVHQ